MKRRILEVGDKVSYMNQEAIITQVYNFGYNGRVPVILYEIELTESNKKRTCYYKDISLHKID